MDFIFKIWPYLKNALGIIFLLGSLTLPFLLIALAISKKKIGMYIEQINKQGSIQPIKDIEAGFDLFIALHLFVILPAIKNNPKYGTYKVALELEKRIFRLIKIVKPLSIILGTTAILLIVLLNWLGQ